MCDIMVSYYSTAAEAIYDINRKLHSFPAPDNIIVNRGGVANQTEVGRNLLLEYDIEDIDVVAQCIIMHVELVF